MIKRVDPELEYPSVGPPVVGSFYVGYRAEDTHHGCYNVFKVGYTNRPISVRLNEYKDEDKIWRLVYSMKSNILGVAEDMERYVLASINEAKIERRMDYWGEKNIGREWFIVSEELDKKGKELEKKIIGFADDYLKYINKMHEKERMRWEREVSLNSRDYDKYHC